MRPCWVRLSTQARVRASPRILLKSDGPECVVGLSVSTAVEAVPNDAARRRFNRTHAAQRGEGGFITEPLGVVTGGQEQRRRCVRADTMARQ